MPHIVIECCEELLIQCNGEELMQQCFAAALGSELFDAGDIKVRIIPFTAHRLGHNEVVSQLHIKAKILDGRTVEQRRNLAELITLNVQDYLMGCGVHALSLSVEVQEIEQASYLKVVL